MATAGTVMEGMVLPAFGLEGGLWLALVRGLAVAGLLSVFGSLLFRRVLASSVLGRMEPGAVARFEWRWRGLFWSSWLVAFVGMVVWLLLQAAAMADAPGVIAGFAAVPGVLVETQFGHLALLQLGALLLAALATGFGTLGIATGFAAVATGLQAGHSHAAAMSDGLSGLLASELVHLLAAGAWLGGLVPLLLLIGAAPPVVAADASRRFSPIGVVCVLLLVVTAGVQFSALIGSFPGLIGTGYGLMALVKIGLFGVLVLLAGRNRFRLTPALLEAGAGRAKARLGWSIGIETGVGLGVVLAAGLLTNLPPTMHVQPVWPFPLQPSLIAVEEDAGFRAEAIQAGLALAGALALLVAAALSRRGRWPAVALAGVIGWFAVPQLDVLLVEAYPTSFYRSPTGFTAGSIAAGAGLYPEHCAACHGAQGRGDGLAASGSAVRPADLTAGHLWMHGDGALFWWLSHGIDAPEGGLAMPGFATVLTEDERWALIDFIRALNSGETFGRTGGWSPPVRAPDLRADCAGGAVTLRDLRGRFVRLVIGAVPAGAGSADVVTIVAGPAVGGAGTVCFADDEAVPTVYGLISGVSRQEVVGMQFLIDDEGWLRAVQRPNMPGGWADGGTLSAEISALRARPVGAPAGDEPMNMHM